MAKKRIIRHLPVRLTEAELFAFGDRLGHIQGNVEKEEQDQADAKNAMKARLGEMKSELVHVAKCIREKEEERPVECHEEPDNASGVVRLHRNDTGEVVEARPMTENERNMVLFPQADAFREAGAGEAGGDE